MFVGFVTNTPFQPRSFDAVNFPSHLLVHQPARQALRRQPAQSRAKFIWLLIQK
jgi:hypothetical protein